MSEEMVEIPVLTDKERDSIQLHEFIFHILIKGDEEPVYIDKVDLDPAQRRFFCERISESSKGTKYRFRDKETDPTAVRCRRILSDPKRQFLVESRNLALEFLLQHKGNVNDGAFIIAVFSAEASGARTPMVALIKMDHRKVLEYTIRDEGGERIAQIKEVLNSFVEDRAAVQKCAIVNVGDAFGWNILASERRNPEGIADYFKLFLQATELETPSNLTRLAVAAVERWARVLRDDLPEEQRYYRTRAVQYMDTHAHFDTDGFLNMVIRDTDQDRKEQLTEALRRELEERGVAGQRFTPRPNSIPDRQRRNRVKTIEGVQIIWQGPEEAAGLDFGEPDQNGVRTITVRTQAIEAS